MNARKLIISSVIGVAIIVVILQNSNIAVISQTIISASPEWIALSIISFLGVYILRAYRWRIILGGSQKFSNIFHISQVGYLANNILPFQLGEVVKAAILTEKEQVKMGRGLASIFIERLIDLLVLVILGLTTLILLPLKQSAVGSLFGSIHGLPIIVSAVVSIIILIVVRPNLVLSALHLIERVPYFKKYNRYAELTFADAIEFFRAMSTRKLAVLASFGVTFGIWVMNFFATYCLFYATNFSINAADLFLATVVLALLMSLPAPPGYAGTLEGFWIIIFFALGYSQYDHILSTSILGHIIVVSTTSILGLVGIAKLRVTFGKIFSK